MTVQVVRMRLEHAASVGELLAASHADYPAFAHAFPDAARRARLLRSFLAATARDAARQGQALVALDNQRPVGVALWMPPGSLPLTPVRKIRMTPALLRMAVTAPRQVRTFAHVGARLEHSAHPQPSWYLQAMGVHPQAQRQGIGAQLLAPALEAADRAGLPCHLHTSHPRNAEYYRRHGFEITGPAIEVFSRGPHYLSMTREPTRSGPSSR